MHEVIEQTDLGEVWKGKNADQDASTKKVAVRIIQKDKIKVENRDAMKDTLNQNTKLLDLEHPNVVKYIDTLHDANNYYVVQELVDYQNLQSLVTFLD